MAEKLSQAESDDPLDFLKAKTYPASERPAESLAAVSQAEPEAPLDFLKGESPSAADVPLQFLKAELPTRVPLAAQPCLACRQPLTTTYYALGDKVLCPSCHARLTGPPPGSDLARLAKASALGLCGGLAGAAVWFGVRRIADLQLGLVAILVGYLAGNGVRKGSGNRGGPLYQILAVVITYFCVAANYVPDLVEELAKHNIGDHIHSFIAFLFIAAATMWMALKLPFLMAETHPIGLLIVGIALWEAWKFNVRRRLPISGPYQLQPQTRPAPRLEQAPPQTPN